MTPYAPKKLRGAALPLVLLLVAFNVTVLVALLLLATTELNASRNSLSSNTARVMALNGIEFAGALIAENSTNNAYVTYQNIITNLPGDPNARLETKIANTVIQGNQWTRAVETPTALHSGFAASNDEKVDLNYPVPSSTNAGDTASGYILPRTNPVGSNWRNLHPNMFQMKWVNVYKGATTEPTNLIGRFAFWVDDESTKLNINYSGDSNMFKADWGLQTLGFRFPITRTNPAAPATNQMRDVDFPMRAWPYFTELGGVAGISRSNSQRILATRGNPLRYRWTNGANPHEILPFNPFYSALEIRTAANTIITNASEQSQLAFTATMFSREPELSIAKGIPRFDMFRLDKPADNANLIPGLATYFMAALTNNYPDFASKYDIPRFTASVLTHYAGADFASNIVVPPSAGLTTFQTRARPLINETDIRLSSRVYITNNATSGAPQTNQEFSLDIALELITLKGGSSSSPVNNYNNTFEYLSPSNSAWFNKRTNHSAKVVFDSPIFVNGLEISNQVSPLVPDASRWFYDYQYKVNPTSASNTWLRTWNQWMEGCFAVMTQSYKWTNINVANPTNITWRLPSGFTTVLNYTNDVIQVITNTLTTNATTTNTLLLDNTNRLVFHVNSQSSANSGIRSDPRFGIYDVIWVMNPNGATIISTNNSLISNASIYKINSSWGTVLKDASGVVTNINNTITGTGPASADYLNDPLSPDITPPYTVFHADRGLPVIAGDTMMAHATIPMNSADIGEIPITTFKGGRYLSWSTPRFWGNGRTNLNDGIAYPPDWLMLDCFHTALLPPYTNGVFTTLSNAPLQGPNLEHIAYGRVNINGLKSYFQKPLGSGDRADTIVDTAILSAFTKDFRDYFNNPSNSYTALSQVNGAYDWKYINSQGSRTNILNFIHNDAFARNSATNPYITPFDFTANLAGNTNISNFSTLRSQYWEAYLPGETNTSDRRIESLVRSLQQRFTTRGWQFSVYSLGQSVQVINTGTTANPTYKTNVVGEAYMQSVWERAPRHDTGNGTIVNASPGGAPPMRMLYMREIR